MRTCFGLLLFIATFLNSELYGQSITFEIGASKHFVPESDKFEQPNLNVQIRHKIKPKIEYSLAYSSIKQYWPSEYHDIDQFTDKEEIQWRFMHGLDLSMNFFPLIANNRFPNFMLGFGPSIRNRQEEIMYDCHYTFEGWPECMAYLTKDYDFGVNLLVDFDYTFIHNLGLSFNSILRVYDKSVPSLSFNGGIIYRFNYSN